jgi:hypothetical protein
MSQELNGKQSGHGAGGGVLKDRLLLVPDAERTVDLNIGRAA